MRSLDVELGRQVKGDELRLEEFVRSAHRLLEIAEWRHPEETEEGRESRLAGRLQSCND